jgi:hypothetical protein
MYTAQGELVCVPNKDKQEKKGDLIENFGVPQRKKPVESVKNSSSMLCTTDSECNTGEICTKHGNCRIKCNPNNKNECPTNEKCTTYNPVNFCVTSG